MGEIEPMFNTRLFRSLYFNTHRGFYREFYFRRLCRIFTHAYRQGTKDLAHWFRWDVSVRRHFRTCIQTLTNVCSLRELDALVSILITHPESQDARLHTLIHAFNMKGIHDVGTFDWYTLCD